MLFGASTPVAKLLVGEASPLLLGGLLYLGSGLGLGLARAVRDRGWRPTGIERNEWPWLIGAIIFDGILGPIALILVRAVAPSSSLPRERVRCLSL